MVAPLLGSLLSNPIALLGALSPFLINRIQTKGAALAAEASFRASELEKANTISHDLSDAMDKLLYFNQEAMFAVVFRQAKGPYDADTWKQYQAALAMWNSRKTTHLAQVERYFGADFEQQLQKIQADFNELESQVTAAFYQREHSQYYIEDQVGTPNDFRTKYFPKRAALHADLTEFTRGMIRALQNQDIGTLSQSSQ